jgi:HIRAN domain
MFNSFKLPCIVKLVGVSFGDAQTNIKTYGNVHIRWFALVREPDNPHDRNAIRVALFGEFFMGYIPKETAVHLAPLMDAGKEFDAEFICVNKHPRHEVVGLTVKIIEVKPHVAGVQESQKGGAEHGA